MARPNNLKKVVKEFEEAVVAHSWKGGGHPEDIPSINNEYHRAKDALYQLLGLKYERLIQDE